MDKVDPLFSLCSHRWNYPVINLDRLEIRHCCKTPAHKIDFEELQQKGSDYFANNTLALQRRQEMIRGERHRECDACWKLEDQGIQSFRNKIQNFSKYKNPQWDSSLESEEVHLQKLIHQENLSRSSSTTTLEIFLDNMCNMKCVYCNENFSSSWEQEKIRFGEIKKTNNSPENEFQKALLNESFWIWLDTTAIEQLHTISIIGGEPLINNDFYSLVHKLISLVQKKNIPKGQIDLAIVSNFNLSQTQLDRFTKTLPELSEFFNIKLSLSMDSVGKKAEYIRYGLDWRRWTTNVDQLLSLQIKNLHIVFLITLSALSVSSLKDFLIYVYQKHKRFDVPLFIKKIIVTTPTTHTFSNLPSSFATYIEEATHFLKSIEQEMEFGDAVDGSWKDFRTGLNEIKKVMDTQVPTDDQMITFFKWISTNDQRRGHVMVDVFPEMADFWTECSKKANAPNLKKRFFSFWQQPRI